jgi:hypothetical protein
MKRFYNLSGPASGSSGLMLFVSDYFGLKPLIAGI